MLEGLYTAAAGMAAQQQRMDALSNDVANTNTAGYKRVRGGFRDLIYQADGLPLQPPVTIPAGVDPGTLAIAPDGAVRAGTRALGRIPLVDVRAPDRLTAIGDNLFRTSAASGPATAAGPRSALRQGALEGSDVDLADAMVDMMDAQRSYSLASKAIGYQDQMAQIANGLKR
jgi:flagellar basal-body rod protein FlgG